MLGGVVAVVVHECKLLNAKVVNAKTLNDKC